MLRRADVAEKKCILPEEVRQAAARGWRLLPVWKSGKKPLIADWPNAATGDLCQIKEWARSFPECNWGLATGSGSGVFVLDVDGEAGAAALREHREQGRVLPKTLTASTGRGTHYYFRWPDGQSIRNSVKKFGVALDIRSDGGFVVIPPSVHPNGALYAFASDLLVADAPQWLLNGIASPAHAGISVLHEGYRNDGLFRYACALRRSGATRVAIENELLAQNIRRCRPPLSRTEVLAIAASAAQYAVGGPDPLEIAWRAVLAETHASNFRKFCTLAQHLQLARPGLPIALPLERIGALMGVDRTLVGRYRKRAVSDGLLRQVKPYIAHKMAGLFKVVPPGSKSHYLSTSDSPSKEVLKGLAGQTRGNGSDSLEEAQNTGNG